MTGGTGTPGKGVFAQAEKKRGRPPGKKGAVSAAQVEQAARLGFGFVVMVRGPQYAHWQATQPELDAWTDEAAALLSKIPSKVVESALNLSAAATVAVGLGTMVTRRLADDAVIRAAILADRKEQAAIRNAQAAPSRPAQDAQAPAGAPVVMAPDGTLQGAVTDLFGDVWADAS